MRKFITALLSRSSDTSMARFLAIGMFTMGTAVVVQGMITGNPDYALIAELYGGSASIKTLGKWQENQQDKIISNKL